jgi:hypothetical protein
MSGFPIPLGGGSFEQRDRYARQTEQADRMLGRGAFTEDPDSLVRRTTRTIGNLLAGLSLTISRAIENAFPDRAHLDDLLAAWEEWYRLVATPNSSVESRRQALGDHRREVPDPRLWKIAEALERVVGVGNVQPAQNMAAQLDAMGYSRQGMFVVAFAVPLVFIKTLGQIERLDRIIARWKPVTVNGHVTHPLGGGFLTDDANSLTNRDVLED